MREFNEEFNTGDLIWVESLEAIFVDWVEGNKVHPNDVVRVRFEVTMRADAEHQVWTAEVRS